MFPNYMVSSKVFGSPKNGNLFPKAPSSLMLVPHNKETSHHKEENLHKRSQSSRLPRSQIGSQYDF
jgi:hypothetical protein